MSDELQFVVSRKGDFLWEGVSKLKLAGLCELVGL